MVKIFFIFLSMKYAHTNIITKDWRKLSEFYINVFECIIIPPERDQSGEWLELGTGVKNAHLRGVHLLLPGFENGPTLEIYEYDEVLGNLEPAANRLGYGHIAFEVENVQEIVNKISQYGGRTTNKIISREISGKGNITFTYAQDPDGNLIEIQSWN